MLASREARRHALVGTLRHWKARRAFQIEFLMKSGLKPKHYVLDLGSGTLRGGLPIIAYLEAGHYYGLEVRSDVFEEGLKELREAGLEGKRPVLRLEQDLHPLELGRRFEFVWAYSLLIHLTDARLEDCLRLVASHIADGGIFFATVNLGARRDGKWREFPLVFRPLEFYALTASRHRLKTTNVGRMLDLGVSSDDPKIRAAQHMLRFENRSTQA